MSKEYEIDFINCTEDECSQFSNKVNEDEINEVDIIKTFDYFKNKEYYSEEDAIKLIKNVVLTSHLINFYRTDYITYCGRLILTVAKFVIDYGSSNFKILYALCISQFNEDASNFKDNANGEIINEINERFSHLKDDEIEDARYLQETFHYLLKKNRKFIKYIY